jgi:hypothetical protein
MNGPVILNNARELLADKIFGYSEPKPSPLKISPWLAMSLLLNGHETSPWIRRERDTLSHRERPIRGGDGTSMLSSFPEYWSILLTFKNNCGGNSP